MADDDDDGDDNDVDGEPMVDEDVDGEPMVEDVDVDETPEEEEMRDDDEEVVDEGLMEVFGEGNGNENENDVEENAGMSLGMTGFKMGSGSTRGGSTRGGSRGGAVSTSGGGQRKRMRAEDMFADDDED